MGWSQLATKTYVDNLSHTDTVSSLTDTTITGASIGEMLIYNETSEKWVDAPITAGSGLDITLADGSVTLKADIKANSGVVIDSTELSLDLGASGIAGTLAVKDGGTGAATFTDGGILLGSADNPITAMGVLADSYMLVGDGTTDPVAETTTTLRTSIGVGTTDNVHFADVECDDISLDAQIGFGGDGLLKGFDATSGTAKYVKVKGGTGKTGTNVAGGALYLEGGDSIGTSTGGFIYFKTAPGGNAGVANAAVTALTIDSTKRATFEGAVIVKGDLDIQGTTTTIDAVNLSITDPHIMLNVANTQADYTAGDSSIIFGHTTDASGGKITNVAGTGFKFTALAAADAPNGGGLSGRGSVTPGAYVDAYMKMPVLEDVDDTPTVVVGALWFDGTNVHIGTA